MNLKPLLTVLSLAFVVVSSAQNSAHDFTPDDCSGVPHHLFSELDANYAVVLDMVMMNCPDCAPATVAIAQDVIPNTIDPSRVKFYSIGFDDMITCPEITAWATDGGVDHPVFAGMTAQTDYYGGMGMPTIVVLGGGAAHTVYYHHLGYAVGLNGIIADAIDQALSEANGVQEVGSKGISVSPDPAIDLLTIAGTNWTNAQVVDVQGRILLERPVIGGRLDVSSLYTGVYVMRLTDASGGTGIARFEKQ